MVPPLFSYGTLRDLGPEVVAVSGQSHHPVVVATGDDANSVDGSELELTDDELAPADRYEMAGYHRILVALDSGVTGLGLRECRVVNHD